MSPKYSLNKEDGKKIGSAFIFSLLSAAVAFLIGIVQEIDFAQYAFIVPVINVFLYSIKRWAEER